ncbi:bcl-2-binding component 3 isoform X2 [Syngnathoides biaculeatus]|uniref:bcl-2-binding component 3 isoform X2 n=1 Tax=Syngnathoides biaculeatus TaxID=300417 RepID=UPI002ADE2BD1|nr:bcl-2-binding component 3 isoform X2 [Syngnathoides biaculeatus]
MTLFYAAAPGLLRLHPPADTETHHLPTSIEMARAATLENVGEAGGGASAPLPHRRPAACHSALPNGHLQNGQQNRREQPGAATPPPSPPGPADAVSGEQSAPSRTDQRPHREAAHRPTGGGPLPRREATLEARRVDTSGVARQLRTIGDQLNASMLREHDALPWQDWHDALHWQDWIQAARGFLNLAARSLSALYRMA